MARFFHLSDIHVTVPRPGWTLGDVFSKHATGWVNWTVLRRRRRFGDAHLLLQRFVERVRAEQPDAVIFSGDATAMGFAKEAADAAELLHVREFPGFAVPGNHDHYTPAAVQRGGFEDSFQPWLLGERVDAEKYPFAKKIAGVWLVGVNSAVPNRGVWDASGWVGTSQLQRLDRLLTTLSADPRVLVTHYPFVQADGAPESSQHGLRDRFELAEIVSRHGIVAWLCGHRHHHYRLAPAVDLPFHLVCAGSATMRGESGYWEISNANTGNATFAWHSLRA